MKYRLSCYATAFIQVAVLEQQRWARIWQLLHHARPGCGCCSHGSYEQAKQTL